MHKTLLLTCAMLLSIPTTTSADSGCITPVVRPSLSHTSDTGITVKFPTRAGSDNDIIDGDVIETLPENSVTRNYSRSCTAWTEAFGYLSNGYATGYVQHIAENGQEVYLDLVCCSYSVRGWIKGDKDADGNITLKGGQLTFKDEFDGEIYAMAFFPLRYTITGEHQQPQVEAISEVTLTFTDGGYVMEDDDIMLSVCEWRPEKDSWVWTGFGDADVTLSPITDTVKGIPATLEADTWSVLIGEYGYKCKVAADNESNLLYVQGLIDTNPDAAIVGEIAADGKTVTFPEGQFIGEYQDYLWQFLYGGDVEMEWDENMDDYVYTGTVTGPMIFNYDSEKGVLEPVNDIILCLNKSEDFDKLMMHTFLNDFVVEHQKRNPLTPPSAPFNLEFIDYEDESECQLIFDLAYFDADGVLLDAANLYYRIYIDGEPFIFYGSEYEDVSLSGTDIINCDFCNYDNIYPSGINKWVFFSFNDIDEIGVQSVYLQTAADGSTESVCSNIVSMTVSGIDSAVNDATPVSTSYYDLHGRRVSNPSHGVFIRNSIMPDGTVRNTKVIK